MAEKTKIQWTTHTFNPWHGCQRVSEGCRNCYAETQSLRNPRVLGIWGPAAAGGTRVLASEEKWREPLLKWNEQARKNGEPALVFCASIADVFEQWEGQMTDAQENPVWFVTSCRRGESFDRDEQFAPYTLDHARDRLWRLIRDTPYLIYQLLTKRPENIPSMMPAGRWDNVWLGASVESQDCLLRMEQLQVAAETIEVPVRFCSAEPLLGSLDLHTVLGPQGINWVIVGGESGGGARECWLEWVRQIRDQCRAANVACFIKQLGKLPVAQAEGELITLRLRDRKGGDVDEWPEDLRVREFPD